MTLVVCCYLTVSHCDVPLSIRRQRQTCIRDRLTSPWVTESLTSLHPWSCSPSVAFPTCCIARFASPTALTFPSLRLVRRLPHKRPVSYTHLRAHEPPEPLVCRLLLEKKNTLFALFIILRLKILIIFLCLFSPSPPLDSSSSSPLPRSSYLHRLTHSPYIPTFLSL